MNIKINIATKQIELLDSIPFEETKKLVDALIAAYGWDAKDVRIKSVTEIINTAPVIIERRGWYEPWWPYVAWCGGDTLTNVEPITVSNHTPTITFTGTNTK